MKNQPRRLIKKPSRLVFLCYNENMVNLPLILIIMDGWGIAPAFKGNAVTLAKTPNLNKLWKNFPHTILQAAGREVGLPPGQDGNSEAGHLNLGAGRIVEQDAVRISRAINTGIFAKNAAFQEAIKHVRKHKSRLHLMGMLGNEMSAHAYPDHLYALLALMEREGVFPVYLHLFTDGRDSPQHAAIDFLKKLRSVFYNKEIIATIMGRYYAMERNKRWLITEKAYNLLTLGQGEKASSPEEAILRAYNRKETDEFIQPTIINKKGLIQDEDAVIFFNLRSDRTRQLTKAFIQKNFNEKNPGSFKRKKILKNLEFIAMTDFGPDLDHVLTAFPGEDLKNTLPFVLQNFRQLYIAESEKYAHVTFFFNGGYADPVAGEKRIKVPSPDCSCYDEKPEMSAKEISKIVLKDLAKNNFDFYTINFANPDMVGHTGNLKATIQACECVDEQVGKITRATLKHNGLVIITADHGNAEEMLNIKTGEVDTEHSTNPVPLIITKKKIRLKKGILGNIAPTIIKLLNLKKPKEMNKESLW